MQKKIVALFFIICVVGIIVLLFLYFSKERTTVHSPIYSAIPANSNLIFEIKNIGNFVTIEDSDNKIFAELKKLPSVSQLYRSISHIDSLINAEKGCKNFRDKKLIISTHLLGQRQIEFLFLLALNEEDDLAEYSKLLKDALQNKSEVKKRKYNEETIYDVALYESSINGFTYAFVNSIFIASPSPVIVEMAIRQLHSEGSIANDPFFNKVKNSAGKNVDVNIFVDMKTFPTFASAFINESSSNALKSMPSMGAWAEFDANIKSGSLLLNGFTTISDEHDYFNVFLNQKPVNLSFPSILPAGTSTFWAVGFNDVATYKKDYENYLKINQLYNKYTTSLNKINEKFSTDPNSIKVNEIFFKIIEEEMAMVYANVSSLNPEENTFAVFKTKSQNIAKEQLIDLLNSYCEKNAKDIKNYISKYPISDDVTYKIYNLPVPYIPYTVFGRYFQRARAEYFTFIENYLVYGNSIKSLKQFIHAYELKKTLNHNNNFEDFTENLSDDYNFYFYSDVTKSYDIYPEYVNSGIKESLNKHYETFQKFQALAFQYSSTNKMLYSNFYLNYNPVTESKPHTIWESYLDTIINFKPKLVNNHETDDKNIFVQDEKNKIYLLNKAGRIIWTKMIKEKINSHIFHIDFYKNRKIQYAFSTKNYIYIIDRIGNFVEHYPVKLESEASAGMTLLDYDKNRNYRIIIPAINKKVYLFDKDSKVLKDWGFHKAETPITKPIQHFKLNEKDYLVFADRFNTYILNRRGEERVTVKERFEKSKNNFFILERKTSKNEDRLATTDTKGNVKYIYFNGTVQTVKINEYSPAHYFEYRDFDADGYKDYVFQDGNKIETINQDKKEIFSFKFKNNITYRPVFYQFSAKDIKTGIVDIKDEKIYLLNGDGSIYKGFPLKGRTLFSIGNLYSSDKNFNLIVGGNENFLYNYEVK